MRLKTVVVAAFAADFASLFITSGLEEISRAVSMFTKASGIIFTIPLGGATG